MRPSALLLIPRPWLLTIFLAFFHLVCLLGPASAGGRLLFLAHVGVGLLWQPFVHPERRLAWPATFAIIAFAACYAYFLDWLPLLLWTMLLTGLIGGKVFLHPARRERWFYLLALAYLVLMMLAWILPGSLLPFGLATAAGDPILAWLGGGVLLAMGWFGEKEPVRKGTELIDAVYGLLVFLLVAVIALAALSLTALMHIDYRQAVLIALAVTAGLLFVLGFSWNPQAGFGGLGLALRQHMQALNQPLERWIETLAQCQREYGEADEFLAQACAKLPQVMPGILGGHWQTLHDNGTFGKMDGGGRLSFVQEDLTLILNIHPRPGETLRWDYDLALRLLADYHAAKRRARELLQLTYLAAIHETGSRLTHDVKNLLQSLETLCAAAGREHDPATSAFQTLLKRQLPEITRRLSQTLNKLAAPSVAAEDAAPENACEWLSRIASRYETGWIRFVPLVQDFLLDQPALFTTAAENLLQNLHAKHQAEPTLTASLSLSECPGGACLEVCDDGSPLPPTLVHRLLREPVPSPQGLGVGLYQCARYAERLGYRLVLYENRAGRVCFSLRPASVQETSAKG